MTHTQANTGARAGRREWIGLAALCLPCLVVVMDFTLLNLAVPSLAAQLKPSPAQMLWIIDTYGFLLAGSVITMGNVGDRIGRRKLLMIGAAAFACASLLAAFSSSAAMLIAARALLGVAGATLAPSTLSLIRSMFHDEHQRIRAISIWGTGFAAGGLIGPVIGGLMLHYFWWGSVFLISVPVMALLLIVGPRLLPEYKDPNPGQVDVLSALLSLAAVLLIIYGLKQVAQDGAGWLPAVCVAAGLAIGAVFIRRQRRLAYPLIDLKLFRSRAFVATLAALLVSAFVMYGLSFYFAQHLQLVLGLSPLDTGLATVPSTLVVIAGSLATPALVRRFRPTAVLTVSLVMAGVGFALAPLAISAGLPQLIGCYVFISLGMGPVGALASALAVGNAPPERAGAAASLSEVSGEFGGALGLALLGSIGVAIYRAGMASAASEGLPPQAAEAARRTLEGALDAAKSLPGGAGSALLSTARGSFTLGFMAVAVVCAALLALTALMVGRATNAERRRETAALLAEAPAESGPD